jgi:Mycothiol maleylpyruvate isomerase N-terminal domain
VNALIERVTAKLTHADPDALIHTIGGGMRIRHYLPTRTFELVVHSLDITAATGLQAALPPEALAHATRLAADIAIELGQGPTVLQALTGRARLPHGFSVV